MIVLPGRKYFEILISTDQIFGVECSYDDYLETLKFTGSDENTAFIEYQKKWVSMQKHAASIVERQQNNKQNRDSLKILSQLQKSYEEEMKSYLQSVMI